jgi:uncharacterized protein
MLSEKPWKLDAVVRLLFGLLMCISIAQFILGVYQQFILKHTLEQNGWPLILIGTLAMDGLILLAVIIFLRSQRLGWTEAFGFATPGIGRTICLSILVAVLFLPIGGFLQVISLKVLDLLRYKPPLQQAVASLQNAPSPGARIYMVLFAVLVAPVAEETFFRGILYPTIKKYGNATLALWVSSLVFGAIHMNLSIFLPLTVLGMILVWLYERTNNLLACIAAHSLFNMINVVAIFFGDNLIKFFSRH